MSSSGHGDDSWERVVSVEENETRVGVVENHVMNIRRVENENGEMGYELKTMGVPVIKLEDGRHVLLVYTESRWRRHYVEWKDVVEVCEMPLPYDLVEAYNYRLKKKAPPPLLYLVKYRLPSPTTTFQ